MKKVVILQPIYGNRERAINSLKALIENELKELEVKFEISVASDQWAEISLEGEDEDVSRNFLVSKYGTPTNKAEPGKVYRGFILAVEEDLLVVNIGIPVRVEARELKALGSGKAKQLASRFGLIPHLPAEIEIIESKGNRHRARFSKQQLDLWWEWKKAGTDRVIINAATRSEIKSAIKKTGHGKDIYEIERLGLMEHAIVCREKTDGPGIVAAIGPLLKSEMGVVIRSTD